MKKQEKEKTAILEQLAKTPILQYACERAGVARANLYRWRQQDAEFNKKVASALNEGTEMISDMAESQLLSAIRDKNMTAIVFWLKNHHQAYADKLRISGDLTTQVNVLTLAQEKDIKKSLMLASLAIKKGKHNVKSKS